MAVQGVQLDLIRLIASLEHDPSKPEVWDTLIAAELGLKVGAVARLLEGLAFGGYIYLKRGVRPGYMTWLSPKGHALCPPRATQSLPT